MMKENWNKITDDFKLIALFIGLIWLVFFLDRFLPLENYGLLPRQINGLFGIISMPFLHANFSHLMSNTVPLIVLLLLLAGSRADSRLSILLIIPLSGLLLWLFGRGNTLHIGASGIVFGLAIFLIVSGLLEKRLLPLIISVTVAILYGSTLLSGIMPWQTGISWDGHLLGGIAGALIAWLLIHKRGA